MQRVNGVELTDGDLRCLIIEANNVVLEMRINKDVLLALVFEVQKARMHRCLSDVERANLESMRRQGMP